MKRKQSSERDFGVSSDPTQVGYVNRIEEYDTRCAKKGAGPRPGVDRMPRTAKREGRDQRNRKSNNKAHISGKAYPQVEQNARR